MRIDKRSFAAAQDDMPVGLRYVGGGEFIPGAPARDLSGEEAEALRALLAGPAGRRLYVVMGGPAVGPSEVKAASGGAEATIGRRGGGAEDV